MKPRTLEEFAEELRVSAPDFITADFADEILELVELDAEVAEPYRELCEDIKIYAADYSQKDDASKALEWLGDRSNLLEEIKKLLEDAGRKGDVDDVVKEMLGTLAAAEAILEEHGWPGTDFLDALENLAENVPTPKEYDL